MQQEYHLAMKLLQIIHCSALVLVLLPLLGLVACSSEPLPVPEEEEEEYVDDGIYRVLDLGNSYSLDATAYLKTITEATGADVSLMSLYTLTRGGASYRNWVDAWNGKDKAGYSYNKVLGGTDTPMEGSGKLDGEYADPTLLHNVLTTTTWDLIIIHQFSYYSNEYARWNEDSAAGGLDALIQLLKENQPHAKLGFLLVHASNANCETFQQTTQERWLGIAQSAQQMQKNYGIEMVIPYGTAVENLRLTSYNDAYNLCRDNNHLGMGLARYTAACAYYEALIAPYSGISMMGNTARYSCSLSDKLISTHSPCISVTDANAPIAQQAAYDACQNYLKLTQPLP